MTTRRTPDGQVYTEVPVVPRHDQLDGRSLGNSHPISAITGLQEALDSKADAVDGGNLVTDEEKAKIETMEANAQENVVEVVKVNGTALTPDASKAVDVTVPTDIGNRLSYVAASGRLELLHFIEPQVHPVISSVILPRKGLTAMALDSDSKALTATLQDGTTVSVDLSDAADPYTAGNGLALADGAFSLSSQTEGLLEDVADHLSDQTAHVSAADRTKWDGCAQDSAVVHKAGSETIPGAKTFTSPVGVGSPTASGHAVDMATLSSRLSDGSVTKVGTADVGTNARPVKLVGGVPTAVGADLATDSAVVHKTGTETIDGGKTYTAGLVIQRTGPVFSMRDTRALGSVGTVGKIEIKTVQPDSSLADQSYIDCQTDAGSEPKVYLRLKAFSLDRLSQSEIRLIAGEAVEGQEQRKTYVLGTSYFPVNADEERVTAPNGALITQAMLATDPTVVHTTGAETVAGVKTFAKPAALALHEAMSSNSAGWRKLLVSPTFSTANEINVAVFEITDNSGGNHARFKLTGRNGALTALTMVFGDYSSANIKVSRDSAGEVIIWGRAYRTVTALIYELHAGSDSTTFKDSGTTAIFDEPTTPTYAQVISPN